MKRILLAAILVVTSTALSAVSWRVQTLPAFKDQKDTVTLAFRILGSEGGTPPSLAQLQPEISDNGTPIQGASCQYQNPLVPAQNYVVLALDVSGSMRYADKLQKMRRSALRLIDAMTTNDNCAVIVFSSTVKVLTPFTNDKAALKRVVIDIQATNGYTAIYDALLECLKQVEPQPKEANKVVLLLTDGREEGSTIVSLTDISPRLQGAENLTVHTFDLSPSRNPDLIRLAALGNGSYFFDPQPDKVFAQFARAFEEYKKVFVVRYALPQGDTALSHTVICSIGLPDHVHKVEMRYFNYPAQAAGSLLTSSLRISLFSILGCGLIVGLIFAFRRRKPADVVYAPMTSGAAGDEPTMAFKEGYFSSDEDERTQSIDPGMYSSEDDEKTLILDRRTGKRPLVLGYLVIREGKKAERLMEIDTSEILIGRSAQCQVRFDDTEVSRLHAKLRLEAGDFVLYDLGSSNGTRVGDIEIAKRVLNDGETIAIGGNTLVLKKVMR